MRVSRVHSKVSLVVHLSDAYTGKEPIDPTITVQLSGHYTKPYRKNRAVYIFENLKDERVTVHINTQWYGSSETEVELSAFGANWPILYMRLRPSTDYPFQPSATLVRGVVADRSGKPICDATIEAYPLDVYCAKARIAEPLTNAQAREVPLVALIGTIQSGETFAVWDMEKQAVAEMVTIADKRDERDLFSLVAPLEHAYTRGTPLVPVISGKTDEKGQFVIPFPGGRVSAYPVKMLVRSGEYTTEREVEIQEGFSRDVGTIVL